MVRSLGRPAVISTLVMAPFALLELISVLSGSSEEDAGHWLGLTLLFVAMWLLVFVFVLVFRAMVRDAACGGYVSAHPFRFAWRVGLLLVTMALFAGLLFDQFPCFLGATNCD